MTIGGSVHRLCASLLVFPVLAGPALAQAPRVACDGYVETFYSYNFGEPADAVTPNTYYQAEPTLPGTGGPGASDQTTWRLVQEAYLGWRAGGTRDVRVDAVLFLSPVGPEVVPVKDNWNWSRSTLFYGLPFYHTGVRSSMALGGGARLSATVFNGWNSVNDNNGDKSLALQGTLDRGGLSAGVLYFGGVEREPGAPEGDPWRHMGDAWAKLTLSQRFALLLHGNVGVERGDLGTSDWYGASATAHWRSSERTALGIRADVLTENAPAGARTIFWPTTDANGKASVGSFTFTGDLRPGSENLLLRLELRRDASNVPMYVRRGATTDLSGNLVPNATSQTTLTLGAVAWL